MWYAIVIFLCAMQAETKCSACWTVKPGIHWPDWNVGDDRWTSASSLSGLWQRTHNTRPPHRVLGTGAAASSGHFRPVVHGREFCNGPETVPTVVRHSCVCGTVRSHMRLRISYRYAIIINTLHISHKAMIGGGARVFPDSVASENIFAEKHKGKITKKTIRKF